MKQRPKQLRAQRSPARERVEGAGPKTHIRGFFEKVRGTGLVGCYWEASGVGNQEGSGHYSPNLPRMRGRPEAGGRPGERPWVRGRRLGSGVAPGSTTAIALPLRTLDNEMRWRARGPQRILLLVAAARGGLTTHRGLRPSATHRDLLRPPASALRLRRPALPAFRARVWGVIKGRRKSRVYPAGNCVSVARDGNIKKQMPPCWIRADAAGIATLV